MIYQGKTLSVRYLQDGIAELNFNATGSINKLDVATLHSLNEALDKLLEQTKVKALLLTTEKDSFIVGADISEFLELFAKPEKELSQWLSYANQIFNKLEDLPFPTVSIIKGYALGGGCECTLATDFRISDISGVIGLPETTLGIIPGFGGTVRLPRLLGADSALEIIASGKPLKANAALKIGLIDAVTLPEDLLMSGISIAHQAIEGKLNWKMRRKQKQTQLQLNNIESTMCFHSIKAMVTQRAGPHYPAPITAVMAIEQAATSHRENALSIENKFFVQLAKNNVTRSLVNLFLHEKSVKSKAKKACQQAKSTQYAAVIGAGIMGGGIAYQSAQKGIPILMKDINQASLDAGMFEATELLNKKLKQERITSLQMAKILTSITPSLYYTGIEQADIVIEAVIEDPKVKTKLLCELEDKIGKDTILTSNTSTIEIDFLAASLKNPQQFCGMHFFNPVHRMPLVEIIRGKQTSDETISRVLAYALKMGKKPIVVNDCPGFFVNRVLFPYLAAFSLLVRDGANFVTIDKVMEKNAGWPMGPAHLLDVVGIDTAHHAQAVMAKGFPDRMSKKYKDCVDILFENKRLGQKNTQGFYQYSLDKKGKIKKHIDNDVEFLFSSISNTKHDFADEIIINRMMVPMLNEVVRCLDDGIIACPEQADLALVYGLGFPAFQGGAFQYLDTIGLKNYVAIADELSHLGPLYEVPKSLREKAKTSDCYFFAQ